MTEGVYRTSSNLWIGSGATRRKSISKRYWYASIGAEGNVEVQLLTSNLTPIGDKRVVELEEFEQEYVFEPGLLAVAGQSTNVGSGQQDLQLQNTASTNETNALLARVPTHRAKNTGLKLEEEEATEKFDRGMTMLRSGYLKQGRRMLLAVPDKDVPWKPKHKHLFNDFGKRLRKEQQPEIALKHYLKASELSPNDDHLCYNIARVYYDLQKMADCKRWLHRALVANPQLEPAQKFLQAIKNR
jgi:tetratricopeptide (TPR) repeat protein